MMLGRVLEVLSGRMGLYFKESGKMANRFTGHSSGLN